jgi:hypothetical protein
VPRVKASELVTRAKDLLWVIARCDVDNVGAHRPRALEMLRELERQAIEMRIDLYEEVTSQD